MFLVHDHTQEISTISFNIPAIHPHVSHPLLLFMYSSVNSGYPSPTQPPRLAPFYLPGYLQVCQIKWSFLTKQNITPVYSAKHQIARKRSPRDLASAFKFILTQVTTSRDPMDHDIVTP